MNRRLDLYTVGWALIGLLLLGVLTLTTATASDRVDGNPYSYNRGGSAAMVELLRASGYTVVVDPSLNPDLRPNDLAIAFDDTESEPQSAQDILDQSQKRTSALVARKRIRDWRDQGGSILWLPVPKKVEDLQVRKIRRFPGKTFPTEASFGLIQSKESFPEAQDVVKIGAFENELAVAHLLRIGDGLALVPVSGAFALNYAIGKSENARILLRLVGMLAKPGGRIVLTTATIAGGDTPSFFESIGPWALSAWKQLLLLLVVTAIALGSRFGLPDDQRRREQGSRELVEALGGIYERAKAVDAALQATLKRNEARIAKRLKLSGSADLDAHVHLLPEDLAGELATVRHMASISPEPDFAMKAAARLDRLTDDFVRKTR